MPSSSSASCVVITIAAGSATMLRPSENDTALDVIVIVAASGHSDA
jgi:hypothetical protein